MKVLLDTNIVIHREAAKVINEDIGVLFRWLDNLHYMDAIRTINRIGRDGFSKLIKLSGL